MTLIVRDDDTSFFTKPALLEQVYGQMWAHQLPVCLAVIPAQNASTRVLHRADQRYDPSIPPDYRGTDKEHPITDNAELCAFLNEKISAGLVEIMLHGYSHSYYEFLSDDAGLLQQKLTAGLAILKTAFPAATIQTFIAPYDKMSPVAIELVLEMGLSFCTHSDNLAALPGQAGVRGYTRQLLPTGSRVYTCDEYLFDLTRPASDSLDNARQRLQTEPWVIAVNHYWTYFYDWTGVNQPLMDAWQTFVSEVIQAKHPVAVF